LVGPYQLGWDKVSLLWWCNRSDTKQTQRTFSY
jgi:hypothetical protein